MEHQKKIKLILSDLNHAIDKDNLKKSKQLTTQLLSELNKMIKKQP